MALTTPAETKTSLSNQSEWDGSSAPQAEPGVWLSLNRLRQLPITPEARLALLRELRASEQSDEVVLALQMELAELTLGCCQDALDQRSWLEALEHHDQFLELVDPLAEVLPDQAPAIWGSYGELLSALTASLHGAVNSHSSEPPPLPLRADLALRLAERLGLAEQMPFDPPPWLAVVEQQLVQDAASFWLSLLEEAGADAEAAASARRKALLLLLRLDRLLAPAPPWVLNLARTLVADQAAALLAKPAFEAPAMAELLGDLALLPVPPEQQAALNAALTRAGLSLELLAPELPPLRLPVAAEEPAPSPAAEALPSPATPAAGQPAQPRDPGGDAGLAELVLREHGEPSSALQLNLAPLLALESEAIEAALDDFVWHLPRGSRALPAATTLLAALEPAWRGGLRLTEPAFARLAYLAAAWQRRLAEKLEPLPPLDWQHSLLIELEATELGVLAPLLAAPAALEPALVELRRQHHNPAFWQERQELPWMECLPPLEALRRLHVEGGFYARSHEPLQALAGWGREAVQALLEAELWTDDAACLGLWLRLAQALVAQNLGPLPPLGAPPAADQLLAELAGLEVVYVGDQAAAVQAAHRAGRCFRGQPFGLRVLETPTSRWPDRPAGSFGESLVVLLEAVDGLYRQRPFAVLLADCGAYRLPLLRTVHQRYGVAALSSGRPMASWLGAEA